jgi:aarF domain-containing kinase
VRRKNGRPQIVLLDNGLYREYDEEFGVKYAELWMAILQQDEERIAKCSKALGVGDYELFASMLTARSWQSVRNNIYRSLESEELNFIQEQAAKRATDITSILSTVPSPLLLLLKTNDLLRVVNQDLGSSSHKVFGTTMQACQTLLHQRYIAERTFASNVTTLCQFIRRLTTLFYGKQTRDGNPCLRLLGTVLVCG